jgi:hypothetical protein
VSSEATAGGVLDAVEYARSNTAARALSSVRNGAVSFAYP